MFKNKIAANLIITLLLIGVIAGISSIAIQSSLNNASSKTVYGQTYVPVAGASVSASGDAGSGSALANAQGQYSITSFLDTGNYSVVASAPGFLDQQVDNVAVTAGAQTSNVNIYMNVSAGISGRVTDKVTGLPIPNAVIIASNVAGTSSDQYAFTDANGNYQIIQNLPTGTYNVTVEDATGYVYSNVIDSGISVTA